MRKDHLKFIAAMGLYSSCGIIAKFIDLSSTQIVFLRTLLGSLLLAGIFFLSGKKPSRKASLRSRLLVIASGVVMAVDWLLVYEAYNRIGVSLGTVLEYMGPIIVIALSPLFFDEKINAKKVFAIFMAFGGAAMISGTALSGGIDVKGLICGVLAAFCLAGTVILNKSARELDGMENSVLQLLSTFVTVALYTMLRGQVALPATTHDWILILILGFVNTGIAGWLYFSSMSVLPAQTVSMLGYLEVVFGLVLAAVILHETMTMAQTVGALLILTGAVISEVKGIDGIIHGRRRKNGYIAVQGISDRR